MTGGRLPWPLRLLGFLGLYLFLLSPWAGIREPYLVGFRAVVEKTLRVLGPDCVIHVRALEESSNRQVRADTEFLRVAKGGRASAAPIQWNAAMAGYAPMVLVVCLILWTSLPWKRRGRALAVGVLWMAGFIVVRAVAAFVAQDTIGRVTPVGIFPSAFGMDVDGIPFWKVVRRLAAAEGAMNAVAGLTLWYFVALKPAGFSVSRLLARPEESAPADPPCPP